MLVLSRKKNESIVVDGRIVITIVDIRGDKVRLGIEAPREVAIHRSEVFDAIRAAGGESGNGSVQVEIVLEDSPSSAAAPE